ncbi:2Fe-2S iron-sulfur cluster-binding protein [Streptomyces flaveus]|uniref:2Fe-2S ferredoxin-type domain-containing protein n=1 Tax=Streptomyces flaveus TaxID=66370 RepID=A0A917VTC0_9ACTN|nr:2Fe-2S iron-sulfur cluster-binding protein [Streptomyces flaveus]GGL15711.1 hypothetical protein GCM10010094_90760 [Streptomyces flaveus]
MSLTAPSRPQAVASFADPGWPANGWYAAARSGELGSQPVARTVCGHNLVLFRQASGTAAALADACWHKLGGGHAAETFTVEVMETGERVSVAADTSMLDALREAGVEMMYDCRRGECGLCSVPVVRCDGVLDHRDVFVSERQKAGGERMCVCVSRVMGGSVTIDTGMRPDPERRTERATAL